MKTRCPLCLALAFHLTLGAGVALAAADHPELSEADEAYSAENYAKAAALYRKDAELGVISAQVSLAFLYLDGQGVAQDIQQAAKWFAQAAEQGNAEAQFNLAALLQEGKGVNQDLVQAAKWYRIAGAMNNVLTVEKQMSQEQALAAKQLAEAWKTARQQPQKSQ